MPENNIDKLFKIRTFVDALNNSFMLLYIVNVHISVNESMILFNGQSSIKQYYPMKPIKHDYKIWVREDMNGYMPKFSIYHSKK